MRRHDSDDEEPLDDRTASLTLRSKRTSRQHRKAARRNHKRATLTHLAPELLLLILPYLRVSDVLSLRCTSQHFYALIDAHAQYLGREIIHHRYPILAQCFPLPKLLATVEPPIKDFLVSENWQKRVSIHNRPYQHIEKPDHRLTCTCVTCHLAWNNLNMVLDFSRWQDNLDRGEPIPMIPRGKTEVWNLDLIRENATLVRKALRSQLWYAWILEQHLESTGRAIKRHTANKGNKRRHYEMTSEDVEEGTDEFLVGQGPPSVEFPYHRDEYYLLEAYLPNRGWQKEKQQWMYVTGAHERELQYLIYMANRDANAAPAPPL